MNADILVVTGYFALMVVISLAFKRMAAHSTSDYFRGGGRMLWWMVGATAFMTQFSAWTFTGAAGKAFTDGLAVTAVFVGNIGAYILSYFWFSRRFRNMRVDTPTEAISRRYGRGGEQFFTWAILPLSVLNAGVWLNGLAIFVSAVFDIDIATTIYVAGGAVLLVSLLSGAWGVVASDFVQTLVVAVFSVACAIVALVAVGGPSVIVDKFPSGFVSGPDMNYGVLLVGSFLFFIVKQMQSINNIQDSYRFLNARDSSNARKAALMALVLMVVGTLIWFIPPWATAILYPDAAEAYPALGAKAKDAVYLVFAERLMPLGSVGLLMAGLFAATMSSMDSALNRNAGIFVRSFYAPILRRDKNPSESELMRVSQVASIVNGVLVIFMAQYFQSLKHQSLFDLMMSVSTLLQSPILVPLFFGMFIRRVPDWASWATVLFGMGVSYLVAYVVTPQDIAGWIGVNLTARELSEAKIMLTIAAHLVLTGGFFCLTGLFYNERSEVRRAERDRFFAEMETEVVADDLQAEFDRQQRAKLGKITLYMGMGLTAMVLIPNPLWGRLLFLGCASVIVLLGYLLCRSAARGEAVQTSRTETVLSLSR